jgi:hypothetical protein
MNGRMSQTTAYDPARRRVSDRRGRQKGVYVYIPAAELEAAGIDPNGPPPTYKTNGYQRSAKGHTVIVSLYPVAS